MVPCGSIALSRPSKIRSKRNLILFFVLGLILVRIYFAGQETLMALWLYSLFTIVFLCLDQRKGRSWCSSSPTPRIPLYLLKCHYWRSLHISLPLLSGCCVGRSLVCNSSRSQGMISQVMLILSLPIIFSQGQNNRKRVGAILAGTNHQEDKG